MATLLCFGFGYCAEHFIAEFGGKFERVIGTVRRAERVDRCGGLCAHLDPARP
jgi:hypothetical protein